MPYFGLLKGPRFSHVISSYLVSWRTKLAPEDSPYWQVATTRARKRPIITRQARDPLREQATCARHCCMQAARSIGINVDRILCSITAFRYHQVPPQVLALYPPMPDTFRDPVHRSISRSPIVTDLLKAPIHKLSSARKPNRTSKLYRTHSLSRELPFGGVLDTNAHAARTCDAVRSRAAAPGNLRALRNLFDFHALRTHRELAFRGALSTNSLPLRWLASCHWI